VPSTFTLASGCGARRAAHVYLGGLLREDFRLEVLEDPCRVLSNVRLVEADAAGEFSRVARREAVQDGHFLASLRQVLRYMRPNETCAAVSRTHISGNLANALEPLF
jgi:hypothetical protein